MHYLHRYNPNLTIVVPKRILSGQFNKEVNIRMMADANTVNEDNGEPSLRLVWAVPVRDCSGSTNVPTGQSKWAEGEVGEKIP